MEPPAPQPPAVLSQPGGGIPPVAPGGHHVQLTLQPPPGSLHQPQSSQGVVKVEAVVVSPPQETPATNPPSLRAAEGVVAHVVSGEELPGGATQPPAMTPPIPPPKVHTDMAEIQLTPARRWYLANQSVEANPGVPAGFVVRAVAFLAMGRPWEAVADLDRALRFAVRDATTRRGAESRRRFDDEEARIRLLRGHAHTGCLSYDRAAADFATAAEILDALDHEDKRRGAGSGSGSGSGNAANGASGGSRGGPPGLGGSSSSGVPHQQPPNHNNNNNNNNASRKKERATAAHARAGLGVCYCHMRRWSDAIRTGERAVAELAYDDVARTHVSRAVETARQHLAMERRGGAAASYGLGAAGSDHHRHALRAAVHRAAAAGHHASVQHHPQGPPGGDAGTTNQHAFGTTRRKRGYGSHSRSLQRVGSAASASGDAAGLSSSSSHGAHRASTASPRTKYRALGGSAPNDGGERAGHHHHPLGGGVGVAPDATHVPRTSTNLSMGGREPSAMSVSSLPKNLSIASIAMSLSMASINSDNWDLPTDYAGFFPSGTDGCDVPVLPGHDDDEHLHAHQRPGGLSSGGAAGVDLDDDDDDDLDDEDDDDDDDEDGGDDDDDDDDGDEDDGGPRRRGPTAAGPVANPGGGPNVVPGAAPDVPGPAGAPLDDDDVGLHIDDAPWGHHPH